jgi:HEAT repeat protein
MNYLLEVLQGGDLRSDGHADEVAEDVIQDPALFPLLLDGLDEEDDVVRGRTAHSLEKVARSRPELFDGLLSRLIKQALDDKLPVVKWHLAMLFLNLNLSETETGEVISTLYLLLEDKSVFVKAWTISSLTILALENSGKKDKIISKLKVLENDKSAAVRNRTSKALRTLEEGEPLPKGCLKG